MPKNDAFRDPGVTALRASDPVERAAAVASAGLHGQASEGLTDHLAQLAAGDPDARVRAAAIGALVRIAPAAPSTATAWDRIMAGDDPLVRRRAIEAAPRLFGAAGTHPIVTTRLVAALDDREPLLAEAAAWALGELGPAAVLAGAVTALARLATGHADALVRESAVAALGALEDPAGLDAILAGCRDKPAIRRRAVLALAPFDGPDVDAAIAAARADRDWQVRLAADTVGGTA